MAETLEMLRTLAPEPTVDLSDLAAALEAVMECEQASTSCAMAMIGKGEDTAVATRRALDCADVCQATLRVLSRASSTDARLMRGLVQACIIACEGSHLECGRHAEHHEHCRLHSEAAERAATALQDLLDGMA
jgi:hypothetical protein